MTAILDAIFNISKRSMMPEWHQLDSSSKMSEQQESAKKKTLKSSSMSFWFSTRLLLLVLNFRLLPYRRVAEIQIFEKTFLIVIKDETGLKFKINDSTLFLIGS